MTTPKIGFIGLGRMGRPMASNLQRNGFATLSYDVNPQGIAALVALGGRAAGSIAEVARESDIVFTMLPAHPEVRAVVLDGIVPHARPGTLVVDMSTIDPLATDEVAAAVRRRRSYGQGATKYDHIDTGWNSRLDPIQARFLRGRLTGLGEATARRRQIAAAYREALGDLASCSLGPRRVGEGVWHHFVLRAADRGDLQSHLARAGVGTDIQVGVIPRPSSAEQRAAPECDR